MSRSALILLLALTACGGSAPQPAATTAPRNIVLITIDTLRADRLTPATMPAVSELASQGVRFTNARTVVPLTLPAHTVILTGALPAASGVRVNGVVPAWHGPGSIATVLHGAGYRTGAFVGAYVLNRRFGLGEGFGTYDDNVERDPSGAPRLEAERRGDAVVEAALGWLGRSDGKPFFAWIHLYDPHAPYRPPAEYLEKANKHAYDGEVMFADAQVGRVLDWLRKSGVDGQTIVAVAGDHGEGLGDHGESTHGMLAYDSTLHVPLVIRAPGTPPTSVGRPVSLLSLAGTLLDLAHVKTPEWMAHGSILSANPSTDVYAETQYPRTAGWHSLAAIADDRWKLISSSDNELYDLTNDPGERHNLAGEKLALVSAMRSRALKLASGAPPAAAAAASSEAQERLRALGYVASPQPQTDEANAPNPAEHIYAWNTFERELSRVADGNARKALPGLATLAREYKNAPVFQSTYARALKDTGRVQEALDTYRRLVARWPDDPALYHDLAVAAAAANRPAEAARAEQAALALAPEDGAAANGLGLAYVQQGRPEDAVHAFERAVTADGGNAVYWNNLGNARRDAGNADGAERAYRAALERDPRQADAANGLGVLLVQGGHAADAIAWFDRALASQPDFIDARLNLGIAFDESGQHDRAAEEYRRVLAAAPQGSRAYGAAMSLLAKRQ